MLKVLNLYSGIGGNRKLWEGVDVTAVELNPDIAKIYQDFFPDDKVIVADAHQYLLEHYKEFDFIWSSPPCPTHSKMNHSIGSRWEHKYPDMRLYEEIIFLTHWFKGKWVIENVISYYTPLITPQEIGRHYYWSNFLISKINFKDYTIRKATKEQLAEHHGFSMDVFDIVKDVKESRKKDNRFDRRQILRNCVNPRIGLHIFNSMNNQELKLAI